MKKTITLLGFLLVSFGVAAYVTMPFPGWDVLTGSSRDIIVARCINVQDPFNYSNDGRRFDFQGLIDSDFEIAAVLKGTKNSGVVRISSEYWPRQGFYYLLFQNYSDGAYHGIEGYRVVPLGSPFSTNAISGKPLNDQLQILLKRGDAQLKQQIRDDQQEKSRLDEAIQR